MGPFHPFRFAHSQTLKATLEQKYGLDGIIIFKINKNYKIGIFEAKVIKKYWDTRIGGREGSSRFQRQLNKQQKLHRGIAIWEMFLMNKVNNEYQFDPEGSTCVKGELAFQFKNQSTPWSLLDLSQLAANSYMANNNTPFNIKQVIN